MMIQPFLSFPRRASSGAISPDNIDRIPTMTDFTTSGVTISCSNDNPTAGYRCWNGADDSNGSSFINPSANTAYTWTVDFGSGNSWVIQSYTITEIHAAEYLAARYPKAWTFDASNDGSSWTTLDTKSSQVSVAANNKVTFTISNQTAYRYYRLSVAANGAGALAGWAEVEFRT